MACICMTYWTYHLMWQMHSAKFILLLIRNFKSFIFIFIFSGKKGHEVLVQGGVIDDLAKHLVEQYGIPKRYIEVLDKTRRS